MKNSNVKRQKGMTLIELMVSMVVLAIMVTVAVPTMKGLFERKSIIEVGKFFDRSIKLARSEAINRNAVVRVQPTSASSNWSQGWHLEYTIVDDDGVTTTNEVIRTFPALAGDPSFSSAIFDGTTVFEILPNGQARTLGTFVLSYPDNCSVGVITYTVLLSGILQKRVAACP